MVTVSASAPGKLMLFGEHAVLYGYPCIVTSVDLRIRVSTKITDTRRVTIRAKGLREPYTLTVEEFSHTRSLPNEVRFVATAITKFWEHAKEKFGIEVVSESEFSESYGLGSSSAVTVATIKCLSEITNLALDLRGIFDLSYETVLDVQGGYASGFDVAAATYGGTLYYVNEGKVIDLLETDELPLVVAYSGLKASTVEYVRKVKEIFEKQPRVAEFIMKHISVLVEDAKVALAERDYSRLGMLMNLNQSDLNALGVSTYELDLLIYAARLNGAYGAKISGAGGGDCIIALVSNEKRLAVEKALEEVGVKGAKVIKVRTSAEGVRIEGRI